MKNIFTLTFFSLSISFSANAQDGALDLTFNSTGKVLTSVGTFDDAAADIVVQEVDPNISNYNSRKIIAVGHTYNGNDYDFLITRYNDNGSLDNTFGNNGIVSTDIANGSDYAKSVALQSDGKIVVAGFSYVGSKESFSLARYKYNGTLDSTFGSNGIVTTSVGAVGDNIFSIAIQDDGKIVAAGFTAISSNYDFALTRYNANGTLDNSFDTDGIVTTNLGSGSDVVYEVVIQNDGKIVAAGHSFQGTNHDFAVVRYNTDGSLDNTFSTDGKVTTPITGAFNEYGTGVALKSDGKIVVAGYSSNTFIDYVVVQYESDGDLDNTFGVNGAVYTDFGTSTDYGTAADVVLQGDEKILVGGYRNDGIKLNYSIVRYKTSGAVDSTFGTDGIVTTDFNSNDDNATSITLQNDGKILLAGGSHDGNKNSVAIARYENVDFTSVTTIKDEEISIYPNPFSSQAVIKSDKIFNGAQLLILNSLGQIVVRKENIQGNSIVIDRTELSNGLYFVSLIQSDETLLNTKVLIKE